MVNILSNSPTKGQGRSGRVALDFVTACVPRLLCGNVLGS